MDVLRKLIKVLTIKGDIIGTVLGILLIISLVLIYMDPVNRLAIILACIAGGFMNAMNGLKMIKDPQKKTTGMTFLMMGVMIIILGFIITQYFMK